jgi:hypothetical protein
VTARAYLSGRRYLGCVVIEWDGRVDELYTRDATLTFKRYRARRAAIREEVWMPKRGEVTVSIHSLSDAQLIAILQARDFDEDETDSLTRIVEDEIAGRKTEGGKH